MTMDEKFEILEDCGIATIEEIGLAIALRGFNHQTFNDVLFIRTGYNDFNTFVESELEED